MCQQRKDRVHRNRRTGLLVCPACADRARMKTQPCEDCGERKLIQARGRCFACYKREWRERRARTIRSAGRTDVRHRSPSGPGIRGGRRS